MLNVRLNQELEEKLNNYCTESKSSKSAIVKEALVMYFKKNEITHSAYDLGVDLFNLAGSGNSNASSTYKERLNQKLDEKYTH